MSDESFDELDEELDDEPMETGTGGRGAVGGFLGGLILGAVVGAAVGLLFAPSSGEVTRRRIQRRADQLRDRAEEGVDDFKREARRRIAKLRD